MISQHIFDQILEHFDDVLDKQSAIGAQLWQELLDIHPADIADFLSNITLEQFSKLYQALPLALKVEIFFYLSDANKAHAFSSISDDDKSAVLLQIPLDEFVCIMDFIDDEQLKHYFKLMRTQDQENFIDRIKFGHDSAGGVMDSNIVSLMADFTVEKSIQILQRLKPNQELHQEIYITDKQQKLLGHIMLQDLVFKSPNTHLSTFLKENELVAHVEDEKAEIAKKMVHYQLTSVPVIDDQNFFLGVIPSGTLIEIIGEEAESDVYRISALTPIKHSYFETPFSKLLYDRSSILVALLMVESFSSTILHAYESALSGFLLTYIAMLISTGGNTSSQTSALVIQGLTAGELNYANKHRFIRREILMALALAAILGVAAFIRVYTAEKNFFGAVAVSLSVASVVMLAVILGSSLPLALQKLGVDPAFSAGPVLATIMDILGLLLYCTISYGIMTWAQTYFAAA